MTTPESSPWPSVSASNSLVWILEPMASAMQSSWSVLIIILCTSKELWSSARVHFGSALTHSWSCPHMSWQLSLILFSQASIQRLSLLNLQEAYTLFQYLLWAICMDTLFVSEHVTQFAGAVSISESSMFPLGESESDEAWCQVLCELSAAVPSSGSAIALVGLEGGLAGSWSLCSELGPASGTSPSMLLSPFVELWSLLALTSWDLTWGLLLQWWPSKAFGGQSCFFCVEVARNSINGHPTGGVFIIGRSGKKGMKGGWVSER